MLRLHGPSDRKMIAAVSRATVDRFVADRAHKQAIAWSTGVWMISDTDPVPYSELLRGPRAGPHLLP